MHSFFAGIARIGNQFCAEKAEQKKRDPVIVGFKLAAKLCAQQIAQERHDRLKRAKAERHFQRLTEAHG